MMLRFVLSVSFLGSVKALRCSVDRKQPLRECPPRTKKRVGGVTVDGRHLCSELVSWSSNAWAKDLANVPPEYPITQPMFDRSAFFGDWTYLQHFLAAVGKKQGNLTVDAIGGSFTAGRGRARGMDNAWPARLAEHLGHWGNFRVNNRARPGVETATWLHDEDLWEQWRVSPPDLIILELAVNDQEYGSERPSEDLYPVFEGMVKRLLSLPGPPALLFAEAFRTSSHDGRDLGRHCPADSNGSTTHQGCLTVGGQRTDYCWCSHWWQVASTHQEVLRNYSVPYFSYRDLVWPNLAEPPEDLELFWNGRSHAGVVAHQLIADGIAHMLASGNQWMCEEGLPSPVDVTIPTSVAGAGLGFCTGSLTTNYKWGRGFPALGVGDALEATAGLWQFHDDGRGRPGWEIRPSAQELALRAEGDLRLSFSVSVGASGLVFLDFLTSYHDMGAVDVWFDGGGSSRQTIQGFSPECYSIVTSTTLHVAPGSHTLHVQLRPQDTAEDSRGDSSPTTIYRGNHFKLFSIAAC